MKKRLTAVLVVEDDPASAAVLEGFLTPHGYETRMERSGPEAVAALAEGYVPDIVISDVSMPGVPGYEFCRRLRAHREWRHLPFLFVTGMADRAAKIEALRAGADDLLTKPIDELELLARVDSLVRMSRYRAVLAEREQTESILRDIGEGVIVLGRDRSMVRVNEAARRMLDLPEDVDGVWLGSHVAARFHELSPADSPLGRVIGMIDPGSAHRVAIGWRESTIPDPSVRGEMTVITLRDVSAEHRRHEATTLLLNAVNHKLRTPLTGILAGAELLESGADLSGEAAELVRIIAASARRLGVAVERTGLLAERLAGPARSQTVTVDPTEPAAALAALCPEAAACSFETSLRRTAVVSAEALEVAVREYVANAHQAGAATITIHLSEDDGGIRVLVEDDGPGYPAAEEGMLFDAFFQVDRTGEKEGMGLGLTMVRHAAAHAGGRVGAQCRPGEATQFWLWLPDLADHASSEMC